MLRTLHEIPFRKGLLDVCRRTRKAVIRTNAKAHNVLFSLESVRKRIGKALCASAADQLPKVTTKITTTNQQAILVTKRLFADGAHRMHLCNRTSATPRPPSAGRRQVRARGEKHR